MTDISSHPGLVHWLLHGETGISSMAIAGHLSGAGRPARSFDHPWDPADFRRCLQLLDAVPTLRPKLQRMAEVSPTWARLVDHWDGIETTLREEMKTGHTAPRTYSLIRQCTERTDR